MTSRQRQFLRQGAWFAATCMLFLSIMMAVRNHAFCLYQATDSCEGLCRQEERFFVNKLQRGSVRHNDKIVYRSNGTHCLGIIEACPGDTVQLIQGTVVLPVACPLGHVPDCAPYLLRAGDVVCRRDIVGKAYRLSLHRH